MYLSNRLEVHGCMYQFLHGESKLPLSEATLRGFRASSPYIYTQITNLMCYCNQTWPIVPTALLACINVFLPFHVVSLVHLGCVLSSSPPGTMHTTYIEGAAMAWT